MWNFMWVLVLAQTGDDVWLRLKQPAPLHCAGAKAMTHTCFEFEVGLPPHRPEHLSVYCEATVTEAPGAPRFPFAIDQPGLTAVNGTRVLVAFRNEPVAQTAVCRLDWYLMRARATDAQTVKLTIPGPRARPGPQLQATQVRPTHFLLSCKDCSAPQADTWFEEVAVSQVDGGPAPAGLKGVRCDDAADGGHPWLGWSSADRVDISNEHAGTTPHRCQVYSYETQTWGPTVTLSPRPTDAGTLTPTSAN